jgi:hypothetical protein
MIAKRILGVPAVDTCIAFCCACLTAKAGHSLVRHTAMQQSKLLIKIINIQYVSC